MAVASPRSPCDTSRLRRRPFLVVSGEPSGDALAREVVPHLRGPVLVYGGGAAPHDDVELLGAPPAASMGLSSLPGRVAATTRDLWRLTRTAVDRRVAVAVLVNWTEASAVLGRAFRSQGIRVLQVVAPQVFAWRRGRLRTFGGSCDALAVLFAFEEPLWRDAGVEATFVGHPAAERSSPPSRRVVTSIDHSRVALLPGSRHLEVTRLLPIFLAAVPRLRRHGIACEALLADGLPLAARQAAEIACHARQVPAWTVPSGGLGAELARFDGALAASGTATLECGLADVPAVIAYRVDALSAAVFRRLRHGNRVGLPNLLLGRDVFPELLQDDATPMALADAMLALLRDPPRPRAELLPQVSPGGGETFGARVARLATGLS